MVEPGLGIRGGLYSFCVYDCGGNWATCGDAQVWKWSVGLVFIEYMVLVFQI